MKTRHLHSYFYLHLAVLLVGLTAVFGELIQLSGLNLVWWRMLLTSTSFMIYPKAIKAAGQVNKKILWQFIGIGVLVAIHWVLFYSSIKVANASVAVVMIATVSFFVAFLEPLLTKKRIKVGEIALSLLVIPGIYLMNRSGKYDYSLGIALGLLSSLVMALFSVLNKIMVDKTQTPARTITFIEMTSGFVFLSLIVGSTSISSHSIETLRPEQTSFIYLIILALLCTVLPFTLTLKAQEKLSAFTCNFALNLEPVYGVLLAMLLLHQHKELDANFYLGSGIIVGGVIFYSLLKLYYIKTKKAENQ